MELRNYAQLLLKHWWLLLPFTLVALSVGMYFAFTRPPSFQATSSYVAKLDLGSYSVGDTLYGLDTLSQRTSILSTYCEVMTSRNVREEAYKLIGTSVDTAELDKFTVNCTVIPETNVVLLNVQGQIQALVQRMNEALGMIGISNANKLYSYFGLQPLDHAILKPVANNGWQIGLVGGVLGLIVSSGLVFILEYLRDPAERLELSSIRDAKLGIYNRRYFQQRLAEEINRGRLRHRPISLALLKLVPPEDFSLLNPEARAALLRGAAMFIDDQMRQVDITASMGLYTFAIMMPETPVDEANSIISNLHNLIRTKSLTNGSYIATFRVNSGLVESSGGKLDAHTMLTKANEALETAEKKGENNVELIRTSPMPFAAEEDDGNRGLEDNLESVFVMNLENDRGD
jgi:diguanylate cyclase (GGDEF)-like protein